MAVTSVISLPLLWTFPVQLIFGTHATCIPVQNSYHSRVCFIALCCGSEKYLLTVLSAFNVAGGVFTTQPTVPQGGDYLVFTLHSVLVLIVYVCMYQVVQ